jgi:hypothetical protein
VNNKELRLLRIQIEKSLELLEKAINSKNKNWIKKDIVELLANIALSSKNLKISDNPHIILDNAKQLIESWYNQKAGLNKNYLEVSSLYDSWAKNYDTDDNLAIFLEEKQTKRYLTLKVKKYLI